MILLFCANKSIFYDYRKFHNSTPPSATEQAKKFEGVTIMKFTEIEKRKSFDLKINELEINLLNINLYI